MNAQNLQEFLELPRRKTLELLDTIEALPQADAILRWQPAPGKANIG